MKNKTLKIAINQIDTVKPATGKDMEDVMIVALKMAQAAMEGRDHIRGLKQELLNAEAQLETVQKEYAKLSPKVCGVLETITEQ